MLVTVLCLTYMMIVILIHMVWITSIVKQNMKCRCKYCRNCPNNGKCPMQEDKEGKAHDTDRKLYP